MQRVTIDDDQLADWNDGSAAAARDNEDVRIEPNFFNALVCEVQAWRRRFPHFGFMSGPNTLELVAEPPRARVDI
jgi:hypothetical protein